VARPPDPARRGATLGRATDYVLAHGLSGLSLRPLASALGTSTRMLLYDFGTKELLVEAVLAEARSRLAGMLADHLATVDPTRGDTVRALWSWLTSAEQVPYLRLFFQIYVDAISRPEAYGHRGTRMVSDWLTVFDSATLRDRFTPATSTLIIATLRGLLLDRLATQDADRTDHALDVFAELLDAAAARTGHG
jgi:AcrR family transcriptional regulator